MPVTSLVRGYEFAAARARNAWLKNETPPKRGLPVEFFTAQAAEAFLRRADTHRPMVLSRGPFPESRYRLQDARSAPRARGSVGAFCQRIRQIGATDAPCAQGEEACQAVRVSFRYRRYILFSILLKQPV